MSITLKQAKWIFLHLCLTANTSKVSKNENMSPLFIFIQIDHILNSKFIHTILFCDIIQITKVLGAYILFNNNHFIWRDKAKINID